MVAFRWSAIPLPKIATSSWDMITTPEPAGTAATAVPARPKLSWLLATMRLLNTRVVCPGCGRSGMLHTRMPPVLQVVPLSYTEWKGVVQGKRVYVSGELGCRCILNKKTDITIEYIY